MKKWWVRGEMRLDMNKRMVCCLKCSVLCCIVLGVLYCIVIPFLLLPNVSMGGRMREGAKMEDRLVMSMLLYDDCAAT